MDSDDAFSRELHPGLTGRGTGPRRNRGALRLAVCLFSVVVLVAAVVVLIRHSPRAPGAIQGSDAPIPTNRTHPAAHPVLAVRKVRASLASASPDKCPWVAQSQAGTKSPAALAAEVLQRMTLQQKVGFVVLRGDSQYENVNQGIPSLCIPQLRLSDGPDGVANGSLDVTQLPAAIGLAASFDPAVTYSTGQLEGAEARGKGIDVVQGPELNLARVPQSGRTFEAYGEDPYLSAVMGAANVEGIQSQGVMAEAKHFSLYNQETDRLDLNQDVSPRTLAELYDAPFAAVVEQAHVAAIMCADGSVSGVNTCSDPSILDALRSWGFDGFVRSDLAAVADPAAAFNAGLDLIKPGSVSAIVQLVRTGAIPIGDVNAAVAYTLGKMFAFHLITSPLAPTSNADVATAAHAAVALSAAESSMVLLKNTGNVLPLSAGDGSVAVIGSDASSQATTTGLGSSYVRASSIITPLGALESTLGRGVRITYTPADSPRAALPAIPYGDLVDARLHEDFARSVTPEDQTASSPLTGPGWSSWSAVLRVPRSGTYEFSMEQDGDTWLDLDGQPLIASPGVNGRAIWSTTAALSAGRSYSLTLNWFQVAGQRVPELGFADVSPEIAAAVNAARQASVAIVFVSETQSESVDRPSLYLPGDADALISAVAAVNPRTIVVLNTGGAVLMPWIDSVAAVLEAWYPGEEDGAATAAVLEGRFDPSGHLPLTFPAVTNPSPVGTAAQFPGIDGTAYYQEGLDIGYRWYQANGVTPLFPFGYGLSYTTFDVSHPVIYQAGNQVHVDVTVTNTGLRAGTAVVQAYVHYPAAAGEPPEQLRAFAAAGLAPSQSKLIHLTLPESAFEADIDGAFRVVPGTYSIDIGQSSANLPIHLPVTVT